MAEDEPKGPGNEGFLSRWSRRKQAQREAEPPDETDQAAPAEAPAPEAEKKPEEEVDLAALPRVEDLTIESDIRMFLRKGVPAGLRNAALRRAWSLDPAIRDFIGPADYAWDWNVPGGAPGYVADIVSGPDVEALADRMLGIVRDAVGKGAQGAPPPELSRVPAPSPEIPPESQSTDSASESQPVRAVYAAPHKAEVVSDLPSPPRPRHGGAVPV